MPLDDQRTVGLFLSVLWQHRLDITLAIILSILHYMEAAASLLSSFYFKYLYTGTRIVYVYHVLDYELKLSSIPLLQIII